MSRVVKAMPLDKAPRPDGFTGRLFATCWGIIKDDIMDIFYNLNKLDGRGLQVINQAFICLLPKT